MKSTCFFAYDTLCRIRIYLAEDEARTDSLLRRAEEIAREVEATLSMYDANSELSRMCRTYVPGIPYPLSEMLFDFLREVLFAAEATGGMFDPTIAPLVKLWNVGGDDPKIPDPDQIQRVCARIGYQNLSLNSRDRTVTFHRAGIELDPGAAGKGFALGLVKSFLEEHGVKSAVLDFGGNLYTLGGKPSADLDTCGFWKVAIRHPDAPDTYFGTVLLRDAGIATSSWYEHCFVKDDRVYHHILNPRTGYPQPLSVKSVSILCTSALYTDILSTAFFLLGNREGEKLVQALEAKQGDWIRYVAYGEDGTIATNCETFRRKDSAGPACERLGRREDQ